MEFREQTTAESIRIEIFGRLDGTMFPQELERLLTAVRADSQLILDLSGVDDVSGIGIRWLVLLRRKAEALGGSMLVVGASELLLDALDAIGVPHLEPAPREHRGPARIAGVEGTHRLDLYPTHRHEIFGLRLGFPLPFGATLVPGGVNFSIYSRHARSCTLVLFEAGAEWPMARIPIPDEFRVGYVFAMIVFWLDPDRLEYGFELDGQWLPGAGFRFDPTKLLLDPYARAIAGRNVWGYSSEGSHGLPSPYRGRIVPDDFDWGVDRPPNLAAEDLVIYEMHVRGFTRHASSGVRYPGTFAAIREKIPYLKELGVNCVELMPVFEFDELDNPRTNPANGDRLLNYWGYNTVGFFAPKAGYAATGDLGMQADELKALIKELHRHGIQVILDVVFNHTVEGDERGPTISFRGIDNSTYYLLTPDGRYLNFSGCGNTLNCNHPVVRDLVVNSLRYWASYYRIDGFRFDLASVLGRDMAGEPLPNPPLLEALAFDPILGKCKLIAEAWDAAGLYQVGSFPAYGRWAEWNGRYRDCIRRFLKGDAGQVEEVALRLMGSPDLYAGRGPSASINFVTCHDGFTLHDLVSYNDKHNEANGEDNRDGANDNHCWNCGVEGPTDDPGIVRLRTRQMKNTLTMLLVSQGVPMLLMGDEVGRTQQGNNNAYCVDGPLTWLDWELKDRNAELFRFAKQMIAFRRRHAILRHPAYCTERAIGPEQVEVSWHGGIAGQPDWSFESRSLAFMLHGPGFGTTDSIYVALNMDWQTMSFGLPSPPQGLRWYLFANTAMAAPEDIWEEGTEPPLLESNYILVTGRSVIVLFAG
jgi:glycogen operon protein